MPLLFLPGLAQHLWPILPPSILSLSCRPRVLDEGHRVSSVAVPHPSKQGSVLMPTLLSEHHTALHHVVLFTGSSPHLGDAFMLLLKPRNKSSVVEFPTLVS